MVAPEGHIVHTNGKTVAENAADALGANTAADVAVPGATYTTSEQDILSNLQARVLELEAKFDAMGITV